MTTHTTGDAASDAVVRDVGYTGYEGPRAVERAMWVLAEHTARTLWTRTGVRRALLVSWLPALVCVVQIYLENKGTGVLAGARLPLALLTKAYGVLFPALVVALTAAGGTLAEDRRTHALPFYFARPLRPDAYLLGRVLGVFGILAIATIGPPMAVALFRVALAATGNDLLHALVVTGMVLVLGALLAIVLTSYALLGGALTQSRGAAQSFVALAFLLPWMSAGLGDKLLDGPWLSLLSLPDLVASIGHATIRESQSLFSALFQMVDDTPKEAPAWAAIPALLSLASLPFIVLRARVARLGTSGGEGGDA